MTAPRTIRGRSYEVIHNALIVLVRDGTFYGIEHDKETGLVTVAETEENEVAPESVRANEVLGTHAPATHFRRYEADERTGWLWHVEVIFDKPTSVEYFEQTVTETIVRVPADPEVNRPQITFHLRRTQYHHQTHDAERGTKVTFEFEASLTSL